MLSSVINTDVTEIFETPEKFKNRNCDILEESVSTAVSWYFECRNVASAQYKLKSAVLLIGLGEELLNNIWRQHLSLWDFLLGK